MTDRQILIVNAGETEARELAGQLAAANANWKVRHATDRASTERVLQSGRIDALVADGPLPGVSPEELFRSAALVCPAAFRLALSGNYDHGSSLRTMGYAHQNLWKPCPPAEVRSALGRAFALRDTLRNDRLQLLIAQINTLPSLPRLYLDFLDEVRKPAPSAGRLSDIIRQDIGLCTKMLQLVNSAFFGLPRKIDNPEEALLYLGIEHVRALVLSIQVFSLFDQVHVQRFSLEALWDHSLKTGWLARNIASLEKQPTAEIETAFTAGLLHDVGKLLFACGLPRAWQGAVDAAMSGERPLWQIEREQLAATHAEVGAALLALWGLSDPVVEAVAFHHEPALSGATTFCPLTAVHAANELLRSRQAPTSDYLQSLQLGDQFTRWKKLI